MERARYFLGLAIEVGRLADRSAFTEDWVRRDRYLREYEGYLELAKRHACV